MLQAKMHILDKAWTIKDNELKAVLLAAPVAQAGLHIRHFLSKRQK